MTIKILETGALSRGIGEALKDCLERGFVPPLHAAIVSADGSALVMRYVRAGQGMEPSVLAKHYEGDLIEAPVNIMITDARGEAAHLVLSKEDGKPRLVH